MNPISKRAVAFAAATGVSLSLWQATPAAAQVQYQRVVGTGDQVAGAAPGVRYLVPFTPTITPSGELAFYGLLQTGSGGVTSTSDTAVFGPGAGSAGGAPTIVAREGDQPPGIAAGNQYNSFFGLPTARGTHVAFGAGLVNFVGDTGSNNASGTWGSGPGGTLTNLARQRTQAPGTVAGTLYNGIGQHAMNGTGRIVFAAGLLSGTGDATFSNNGGIWGTNAAGQLTLLARNGDQAPGVPAGDTYFQLSLAEPVINDNGSIAFKSGVTTAQTAIFGPDASGVLTKVARQNDLAPGTEANVRFGGTFSHPSLNNAGRVAFVNQLAGAQTSRDWGVWAGGAGQLALVAREGDAAPGTTNVQYLHFFDRPMINATGEVAFCAVLKDAPTFTTITENNDSGLFAPDVTGAIALVAREGDQAPGAPAGALFGRFDQSLFPFFFNAQGQVAFQHSIGNNDGIWMTDALGDLHLIALENQPFAGADGRIASGVQLLGDSASTGDSGSGGQDGRPTPLNDDGVLAFVVSFTDGTSAIYTATAVPEPSAAITLGAAAAGLLLARRRARSARA